MKKVYLFCVSISLCFISLTILNVADVQAQEDNHPHLEIEVDPLAYILKGYSFHSALIFSRMRYSFGIVGIKQPDFFLNNDAFSVYTTELDFKTDYLFSGIKGFFAGVQLTYGKDKVGLTDEKHREDIWSATMGIRVGYRLMFGKRENQYKGFYISPWLAWLYTPDAKTVQRGREMYRQPKWFPFPALHLGWRF